MYGRVDLIPYWISSASCYSYKLI